MPEVLEEGTLYISMEYCTAIHKCMCGCGNKVVTPISPTGWQLKFDGKSISLSPSIGNWSFDCKSHYWIERNKVSWAGKWDEVEIENGRKRDKKLKQEFYERDVIKTPIIIENDTSIEPIPKTWRWKTILKFFGFK